MNRIEPLIARQPRPKRRVARPGFCSLHFVAKSAKSANDRRMGPCEEPPAQPAARPMTLPPRNTRGIDDRVIRRVEAEVDFIYRSLGKFLASRPRTIIVDNGTEFFSGPDLREPFGSLTPQSNDAAITSTRGAK